MLTTPTETETPYGTTLPAEGLYCARVIGTRRFHTEFGMRIGFELELTEGQPGVCVLVSAADSPSPRSKLNELIEVFTRRPATDTERAGDFTALIGSRCHVRLSLAKNRAGKSFMKVERLFPLFP